MNLFLWVSIINVLIFGAICGYTDLRFGKIFNKSIALGFILGFSILAFFSGDFFDGGYFAKVLVNGSTGTLLGYFFWHYKKWSAGDAKLFAFFSFFVPLGYYRNSYVEFFPAVNILINLFIIIIVYIFFNFMFFVLSKPLSRVLAFRPKRIGRRGIFNFLKGILSCFFVMFVFSQLSRIKILLPFVSNNLVVFFVTYFLYSPLTSKKRISDILSVVAVFMAAYLFTLGSAVFYPVLRNAVLYAVMIGIIKYCFDLYGERKETVGVRVRDLRIGKILLESEVVKIAGLLAQKEGSPDFNEVKGYGLNSSQIGLIKELYKGDDILMVYKAFYLGPLMLAAVIITIATGNSLIKIITGVLPRWRVF